MWVYWLRAAVDEEVSWDGPRVAPSVIGGVPSAIAGALLSQVVGGQALLVLSGLILGVIGFRFLRGGTFGTASQAAARRGRPGLVVAYAVGVGFFTGLLANGGGFLLVPVFVLVLGLSMQRAAGTSLVVVAALSIPTLATHWALGHIDWPVAFAFAAGAIPGALIGSRLALRVQSSALRTAFGLLLVAFAGYFAVRQIRQL